MTDRSLCVGCDKFPMCSLEPLSRHCTLKYKYKQKPEKPTTNADNLRAMSDEELAEIVMCPYDGCTRGDGSDGGCYQCSLDWLQSPAEGGDHDA